MTLDQLAALNGLALIVAVLAWAAVADALRLWRGRLVGEVLDECDRRGMRRPQVWPYVARSDEPTPT